MPMRNLLSQLLAVGPELAAFILTAPLLTSNGAAYAIEQIPAPSPNLDLSALGSVAVAGNFDSISVFTYDGQNENLFNTNGSQSLLTQFPNGAFDTVALSDAYIEDMCPFSRNGKFQGVVVGGNFTSLGGVQARSLALWNPNNNAVTPLPGVDGTVNSVYCDNDAGTVYIGGSFTAANASNAVAWTSDMQNLPFAGFNGQVNSITKNSAGNIVFGGEFDGLGNTTTVAIPNGQVINLAGGTVTSAQSTTTKGFSNPRNIICQTGTDGPNNAWLLEDGKMGYWSANFSFGFVPTKLRLYNTKFQGRGTKAFAFENLDNGGILEMSYTDSNGKNQTCASVCPMPEGDTSAQDFFLDPPVGINGFRLWINAFYGAGAGLAGIEMFQNDIYAFAVNDFNEPNCDGISHASNSTIDPNAGWNRVANNGTTSSDYLSRYITSASQVSDTSIVFSPNVEESGNYSITVYTPGCLADDTCSTRGIVNMTGSMTSNAPPVSTTIFQTNDYDKFDQIYYGYVDVDTDAFRPTVTLAAIAGQPIPQTVVAQRVRFDLVKTTGGLNGLFEYNPNKASVSTDFSASVIDTAGAKLNPGAQINVVAENSDKVYVAGHFSGNGMSNVMSINKAATSLPNGGLNDAVNSMYIDGSTAYMGGNFSSTVSGSTKGLNNVAAFDIDGDKWVALGAGVDGTVMDVVPIVLNITVDKPTDCISFNGDFSNVNAFDGNPSFTANGFAVWVPSKNNWLNNLSGVNINVFGRLFAMTDVSNLPDPLYAGQLSAQALGYSGACELVGSGSPSLQSIGVYIESKSSSSSSPSKRKRSITSGEDTSGVYTGLFFDENGQNVTVLGGHFSATAGGSTVENLMFIGNKGSSATVHGISQLDSNSTVVALASVNTLIFAGGSLTGTANGNEINGVVIYDLSKNALASTQPPALTGSDVIVNAIAAQPDSTDVYIGGAFTHAGPLQCQTLCFWSTTANAWNTPGVGLSGTINSMYWSSKTQLTLAGDLKVGGKSTTMAMYDQKKQTFTAYMGGHSLPGPITTLVPADSNSNSFWASGIASNNNSAFLSFYSGKTWTGVGGLGKGTTIQSLQVLSLTNNHGSTDLVPSDEILLVVGNINIPGFGNSSAVLFNGTDFQPFLLTNNEDGTQGSIAQLFVQNTANLMNMGENHLALGFIVLIGLAIALGIIFLIVVAGILIERARRRREGYVPMSMDKNGNLSRIPPETLLGGLHEKGTAPKV